MKTSELIKNIVSLAEDKFGHSDHNNDCITLAVSPTGYGTWFALLERPTQNQLDRGEIESDNCHTVKICEVRVGFYSEADTMLQALLDLEQKVVEAEHWEFDAC